MMTSRPPVCDYEGSDYQSTFWDQGGRAYEDGAEARALRALLPPRGQLLLEVGAGAGRNTPRYAGFERIVLLDYSRTQLAQARSRLGDGPRYVYVAADVYRLPFAPGLFDCATMIRVIHHMADAPAALRQVRAALRPEGAFLLEFASKRNLKAIARWLLRRQSWNPFHPGPVEFADLNFDFHPNVMLNWLAEAGFRVEGVRALSYFRLRLLKRALPLRLLLALDALLQPTGQVLTLSPSVFVRARAVGQGAEASPAGKFFRCPACGGLDLQDASGGQGLSGGQRASDTLTCLACGRAYPVQDGIYNFKVD
jgi:SAM-dependent methyltransferase/uncharacterized protein YbaR (Trm112 family)